jgi:hypothetical protein
MRCEADWAGGVFGYILRSARSPVKEGGSVPDNPLLP